MTISDYQHVVFFLLQKEIANKLSNLSVLGFFFIYPSDTVKKGWDLPQLYPEIIKSESCIIFNPMYGVTMQ